ncbi:MAG: hypothetical protein U0X40_07185 [Ferruginibacter sp.]
MHTAPAFDKIFPQADMPNGKKAYLEALTARYPYFAPARFWLLKETAADDPAYGEQAAFARLFFSNAHWLHFQLKEPLTPAAAAVAVNPAPPEASMPENADNDDDAVLPAVPDATAEEPEVPAIAQTTEMTMPVHTDNNDAAAVMPQPEEATAPAVLPAAETVSAEEAAKKLVQLEPMLFEPMHMVDYFASQGIKLSEEAQTADKLGKQLKSFTEWLKTMKKIHVQSPATTGTPAGTADTSIQQLAEKSNTEGEILTESMAEVLAMQGKLDRAREVYEKLSLLNPAKSAYFAAKIEQLNGI